MARRMLFAAALTLTGCFNGFTLTPAHVDAPVEEPPARPPRAREKPDDEHRL